RCVRGVRLARWRHQLRGVGIAGLLGLLRRADDLRGLGVGAARVVPLWRDGRRQHLITTDPILVGRDLAGREVLVELAQLLLPGHPWHPLSGLSVVRQSYRQSYVNRTAPRTASSCGAVVRR